MTEGAAIPPSANINPVFAKRVCNANIVDWHGVTVWNDVACVFYCLHGRDLCHFERISFGNLVLMNEDNGVRTEIQAGRSDSSSEGFDLL
jgi:hypothetical protein